MDALYHYCSVSTFHSIIQSRSIRLSSLTLSNDTMEGKLVAKAITRLAERDGLGNKTILRLQELLTSLESLVDGLGFCLSEEGDLLSQWRGYAADATGVSIGFSHAYLQQFSASSKNSGKPGFSLDRVKYTLAGHESKVEPIYQRMRKHIDNGAFSLVGLRGLLDTRSETEIDEERNRIKETFSKLLLTTLELFPLLFHLKAYAFNEEKEWRLVSFFTGNENEECFYRTSSDRIIPCRSYDLISADQPVIKEVVLGPKRHTPPTIVKSFLKKNGFGDVTVRRSEASYR